jgi:ribosomal protein L35
MRLTGRGKIKRSRAGKSHLAGATSPKRTRNLRGTTTMVGGKQARETKRLLSPGRR